jgi:hypothetical protein
VRCILVWKFASLAYRQIFPVCIFMTCCLCFCWNLSSMFTVWHYTVWGLVHIIASPGPAAQWRLNRGRMRLWCSWSMRWTKRIEVSYSTGTLTSVEHVMYWSNKGVHCPTVHPRTRGAGSFVHLFCVFYIGPGIRKHVFLIVQNRELLSWCEVFRFMSKMSILEFLLLMLKPSGLGQRCVTV